MCLPPSKRAEEEIEMTYQKVTGTLSPGQHPGSYNGQDAYNDLLIAEREREREMPIHSSEDWRVQTERSVSDDNNASDDDAIKSDYRARRLTPRECARLQGFPPDWCDDVPHTDSAEYKLWGNGIALPCLLPMLKAMKERGCETLGNFFSGSGAWELAAKIVGMKPIYEAEIEPFPVKIEKARFPECIQLGDVTQINGSEIPYVDVMTNSSPCQNLSLAGNRKGLEGAESRLFSDAIRITRQRRQLPKYWCWENVPGALSSNGGEDFRTVIEEVARLKKEDAVIPKPKKWGGCGVVDGDDWQIAWRVMDAQYYGVPQRRRRIFLVASFGDRSAAEVLFERESVSWNFTEIAKTWEDTSASFGYRVDRASQIVYGRIREAQRDVETSGVKSRER